MKKSIIILILITSSIFAFAQDITFSVSPTLNNALYYRFVAGGPIRSTMTGFNTSFEYEAVKPRKISFGLGITYQYSRVGITPSYDPSIERVFHTESIHLISISYKALFNLKNNFYLSLDPLMDLQLKSESQNAIDPQSGLGLSFAAGKKIFINDSFYCRIEPKIWVHNIIPFDELNLPLRLTSVGINIGIGLRK